MGPKSERKRSQLLFEDSRFAIYLHEGGAGQSGNPNGSSASDAPVVLQVCMRDGLDPAAGRSEADPEADPSAVAGAGARGGGDSADHGIEEVLCADERTYVVRRKRSDLFVEFGRASAAGSRSRRTTAASSGSGCWYGCDDSEDGEEAEAADQGAQEAPPLPPPPATDRAWSVVRLASWAWTGCDLQAPADSVDTVVAALESSTTEAAEPATGTADGPTVEAAPEATPTSASSKAPGVAAGKASDAGAVKLPVAATSTEDDDDPSLEGFGCWYMGPNAGTATTAAARGAESSTLAVPGAIGGSSDLMRLSSSKVEWRITGMAAKMKSYSKGSRIFSPEFDAFGISSLGLVFYPNGNSNAKQGFCSLGLKAPHGSHLRYKLYIGSTERFTDLRHNVTESWGFVDMCKVEDELEQEEDMLRLGVEIVDDIDAHESLKTASTNKIDWVLGNMQNKLRHYRKDVALYSDEFSAGGVDKLRLKFYPAGKKEADLGWCSLYLEAPKGSELRCRLSVGKKSMSFDRLEKFGEDSIWGFLTLCKLQDELEQDQESVRVGLEVLETKRLDGRLSEAEDAYLKTLSADKRTFLLNELDRVEKLRSSSDGSVPSRFRILQLEMPDNAKAVALGKLDAMHSDVLSGESSKLKKWIDGLLNIPFGTLRKPLVSIEEGRAKVQQYLEKARGSLNNAVFGHDEPKQKIVQILCQWIANPDSMSLVLGIQGPPGNGKTTLCRKGIAEALERPFVQISLGGATDASVLEGHSYTYVGSTWGRIAGLIMEAQCMNPVIFFDELDKVSDTPRGEEITGVLTHLTDHSQNKTFTDRYFEGIPLDLSRALFIFSFNDESRLNHVLKDRLTVIHTDGFDQTAKAKIAREYLMPDLLRNVGLKEGDVDIGKEELLYLCQRCGVSTEEGGVRGIKQALESVILHLNELRMTQDISEDEVSKADDGQATEHKADGAQRADSGAQKADNAEPKAEGDASQQKADGEAAGEQKADGGDKSAAGVAAKSTDPAAVAVVAPPAGEADATAATAVAAASTTPSIARKSRKEEKEEKKKKKVRVELPLVLTKELIDQLVTQSKSRRDGPAMMYI